MKITKRQLKRIIKEEKASLLNEAQLDPDTRWDRMDDLREKFKNAIATSLKAGLTADDVQQAFGDVLKQVTVSGYDTRKP
jgi:hypothetical protein